MSSLAGISGQRMIINKVIQSMIPDLPTKFFLIKGPSGSGKTHISLEIGKYWEDIDSTAQCLYLDGDSSHAERAYYPFITALSVFKKKQLKVNAKKSIPEATRAIPVGGDLAGFLIDTILNSRNVKKNETIRYLNDLEQLIISDIDRLFSKEKLLIIAENIQWWDEGSLKLLQLIIEGKLNLEYTFFKKINFLCTLTEDQITVYPKSLNELISCTNFETFTIAPITKDQFLPTLQSFGYNRSLNSQITDTLFSITGGHLTLIKSLALYLADQNETTDLPISDTDLNTLSAQNLIENLFSYRLKSLGASGEQVVSILEYASIIGLSFTQEEISCITKENDENLAQAIERAKMLFLLDQDSNLKKFSHSIIRDFFLRRVNDRKSSYSKAFLKCLTILRPSDYFTRAKYATACGELEYSLILYMLGHLQNMRNGNNTPYEMQTRIETLSGEFGFRDYYNSLSKATSHYLLADYTESIRIMLVMEDVSPKALVAEKYYLLALCLSRSMQQNSVKQAVEGLQGWDELKTEEGEIWFRIMCTLMAMYTHLSNFQEALKYEKKIMLFLSERIRFDPASLYSLNIIRRKSACLHISEVACDRTFKSVQFFTEKNSSDTLIDPVQYYMSLTNHSGNLIVNDDMEKSFFFSGIALSLIKENKGITFPKPYMPANNYIISGLLSKKFTDEDALNMYEAVSENAGNSGDHYLVKSNTAAIHAYMGNMEIADAYLSEIYSSLITDNEIDLFYKYCTFSNLAVIKFLRQDREAALHIHQYLDDKIPAIPDRQYLVKRHEISKQIFRSNNYSDVDTLQNYITQKHPYEIGNAWPFYSRVLFLTDLQLWSES